MMLQLPDLLTPEDLARVRAILEAADWADGNATSGVQSAKAKNNLQIAEGSPAAREAGAIVTAALERSPLFFSAALPAKVFPPLFNRYGVGHTFEAHVDNAIRMLRGTDFRVRTDLSATLFLSDPETYDGGVLSVQDTFGTHEVKLPAGAMVLYPASSLHSVTPVTRGARTASFFWIQSMVREDAARSMLFEMDGAIQTLAAERGQRDEAVVTLTSLYHNLLRRWAEV